MLQELVQQIEDTVRDVLDEVHTALPGIIQKYHASTQTVTVKPVGDYELSDGERLEYPAIADVPIVFPFCQTLNAGMFFPVAKGDGCLIIVSEVELDEWRSGAESDGTLKFDLTSAVVIPGLMRKPNALLKEAINKKAVIIARDKNKISISNTVIHAEVGGTELDIKNSGVTIKGDLKVTGDVTAGSVSLKNHTHTGVHGGTTKPN